MKTTIQVGQWHNAVFASIRGASHKGNNTCCQDAVSLKEGFFRGEPYLIGTTADGHGHSDYVYSERGSVLATLAAEQTAIQFMLAWDENIKNPATFFAHYFKAHLKREWIKNIAQSQSTYCVDPSLEKKHGTTLLCVLIFRGQIFVAQLGDGEICLINKEGEASFLVEPEMGPISSSTWSLCGDHLDKRWRFACGGVENISSLMLSSDGLINSLDNKDEYVKFALALQDYLQRFPPEKIKEALPQWLDDYSERGSADDISLVAINMKSDRNKTNTEKGKEYENEHQDTGTQNHQKIRRRRAGRSFSCPKGRKKLRPKTLQRTQCNFRPKSYYQAFGRVWCSKNRKHRSVRLAAVHSKPSE
jgi:serine/threonine protein phosphatase PrpC